MHRNTTRAFDLADEAVVYVRQSQDRNGQGVAVARQLKETRQLAARLGVEVVRVYRDNDTSATNGKVRPQFERMLADLAGDPKLILAWHQDRLLRLTRDLERVIDLDVAVYFVSSSALDLSTPAGRAVARTVAAWSQYEGEQKAERQRAANLDRAERGEWQFSRRPYGYRRGPKPAGARRGPIEIVPEEAEVIREGYRRYIAGEGLYSIAADWNARRVPLHGNGRKRADGTPVPTKWSMTRVHRLLSNEHYAGLNSYLGQQVEMEPDARNWEPIITLDTWDTYLQMREGRQRKGSWSTSTRWLLSGLAICGVCHGRMLAKPEHRRRREPGGTLTPYVRMSYACPAFCTSRGLEDVDALVTALMLARLAAPAYVRRLRQRPDLAPLQDELKELRSRRDYLTDMAATRLIDRRKARRDLEALAPRIDALSKRLRALRSTSPLDDLAVARDIPARWAALPVTAKRRVLTELGLSVTVMPTRRGRHPFNPDHVRVEWLDPAPAAAASAPEADALDAAGSLDVA